ncbi:MAG: DUF998 domain-containing protein [Acidimicrobiia bacterium]
MARSRNDEGFDLSAAVTRSLLGWGVVAGIFYLIVGVTHALLRDGFSFPDHPLSLLMLGDFGWVQRTNLILSGLMVVAAAIGFKRAMKPDRRGTRTGVALGIYGLALIGAGIFAPDPVAGFPESSSTAQATTSGVLHLAFGGIGFIALATATLFMAGWFSDRGETSQATRSRLTGFVILLGFLGGAALATSTVGVTLLWVAVLAGWSWLTVTSVHIYRVVPHPDLHVRQTAAESRSAQEQP